MGYEARLELKDQRGQRWTGVHTPACVDLHGVFAAVLAQDSLSEGLGGLLESLPASVSVEARLGPNAVGLRVGDSDAQDIVLKLVPASHRGFVDGLLHLRDGSRAQRAHLMAHRLRAHGLGAPRPLGFLQRAHRPRSGPSLQVSTWIRQPDLRAWWSDKSHDERVQRLLQVAVALRGMRAQGLFHGDLHAENLLVESGGVVFLDLESVRIVRGSERRVIKSLVRLHRDALDLGGVSLRDRARFLQEYLRHSSAQSLRVRILWDAIAAGTEAKLAAVTPSTTPPSDAASPPL